MQIDEIKQRYKNSCEIFTSILNTLILLITQKEEEEELIKDVEDFKYIDEEVVEAFKWEILQHVFHLKPLEELNKILPKKIDKGVLSSINSVKDLLKLFHHTPKNNDRS